MAGQTPITPRQPDMVHTSHAGTINENSGSWRPAIALKRASGNPVTSASVMIGVPSAPNATGDVLAISARPAAYSGEKPAPINSAAEIATGVTKQAAPSTNAPKLKAISKACRRRSADKLTTD